jgi:small nuclear ribonucleoprotein (snRNP)-like protein
MRETLVVIFLKSSMKYNVILLFLSFLSYSICTGQIKNTVFYLEENHKLNIELNGKVKNLKIKTKDLLSESADSTVYYFNKTGSPDKIISFGLGFDPLVSKLINEEVSYIYKEGKLQSKLNKLSFGIDGDVYEYDGNMNLILLKEYFSNILVKETISKYDTLNRQVEKKEYLYGGFSDYNPKTQEGKEKYLYEIEMYEYDNNDKIKLKRTYHFRDNKTMELTQYKYDKNLNLIEEGNCISYSGIDCNCKAFLGYEYNSKNLKTREYDIGKFQPHNTDTHYFYDEHGNEIEAKGFYIYEGQEPVVGYDYRSEYNEFGNRTREDEVFGKYRTINFEKYRTQITQYDEHQNIILDEYINSRDIAVKTTKKRYSYDKNGNWLKMETFEGRSMMDLKLVEISNREIEYY